MKRNHRRWLVRGNFMTSGTTLSKSIFDARNDSVCTPQRQEKTTGAEDIECTSTRDEEVEI